MITMGHRTGLQARTLGTSGAVLIRFPLDLEGRVSLVRDVRMKRERKGPG